MAAVHRIAPLANAAGTRSTHHGGIVETMNAWRKSSYSGSSGNNCVEVARSNNAVLARDTTDRDGALLTVDAAAWRQFTASLR
jgi:hypothetical protein